MERRAYFVFFFFRLMLTFFFPFSSSSCPAFICMLMFVTLTCYQKRRKQFSFFRFDHRYVLLSA